MNNSTWNGYHTINTIHPPKKQRNRIAGLSLLIGLVICGYVMIALLVMNYDGIINIQNKLNNYEILYRQCANINQFTK